MTDKKKRGGKEERNGKGKAQEMEFPRRVRGKRDMKESVGMCATERKKDKKKK